MISIHSLRHSKNTSVILRIGGVEFTPVVHVHATAHPEKLPTNPGFAIQGEVTFVFLHESVVTGSDSNVSFSND